MAGGTSKGLKIRRYENAKGYTIHSLTIPREIADRLPKDITFIPKMTDEGLLYVPVSQFDSEAGLPEWAQPKEGEPEKPKPRNGTKTKEKNDQ